MRLVCRDLPLTNHVAFYSIYLNVFISLSFKICSKVLHTIEADKWVYGYLDHFPTSPFLNISTILAIFQPYGPTPNLSDVLKIFAARLTISCASSFSLRWKWYYFNDLINEALLLPLHMWSYPFLYSTIDSEIQSAACCFGFPRRVPSGCIMSM